MSFIHQEKLEILLNEIEKKPYGKFLVYGDSGIGKTTFLNILKEEMQKREINVGWLPSFSVAGKSSEQYKNMIYLVDGIDQLYHRRALTNRIKEEGLSCVCTSIIDDVGIDFDFKICLSKLNYEQILCVLNTATGGYNFTNDELEEILSKIKREECTPFQIVAIVNRFFQKKGLTNEVLLNLSADTYQAYVYGKGLEIARPKILIPERNVVKVHSEVSNSIKAVNQSLLQQVVQKPEILYSITSRQFEEVVCELFEKQGYRVKLTKQTRDGGKDLIILNKDSLLGDFIVYAECKQRPINKPIDVGLVRELYGTIEADRVTAGIMITTSCFTKDAYKFRDSIKCRMNFIDYAELIRQLQDEKEKCEEIDEMGNWMK